MASQQTVSARSSASTTAAALVLGTLCLAGLVYAGVHPSPWHWSLPDWTLDPAGLPSPPPMAPPPQDTSLQPIEPKDSSALKLVLLIVGILVAAGLLFWVARLVFRAVQALRATRITAPPAKDRLDAGATVGVALTSQEVADAVEEALRRLDRAAAPTDAVIMAWLVFEEAAARRGLRRDPAQTPTEFTAGLLERSAVPPGDADSLRRLYSRARFSTRPVTAADVARARQALEHITGALESRRPGPAGPASPAQGARNVQVGAMTEVEPASPAQEARP